MKHLKDYALLLNTLLSCLIKETVRKLLQFGAEEPPPPPPPGKGDHHSCF